MPGDLYARLAAARLRKAPEGLAEYQQLRNEIVASSGSFVRFLARKFEGRGEPIDDLVQVGMIGLLKAIDRFEPSYGVAFKSYATPLVLGEIRHHLRDRLRPFKSPRRLQELHAASFRVADELALRLGRRPLPAEIAAELNVSIEDLLEAQELGRVSDVLSLDLEINADSDGQATLADLIGDRDTQLERIPDRDVLARALKLLDGRERVVLYLRFWEGLTQEQIAVRFGISQMQISRIQRRALDRLREKI
jgi:RNA polymerase sigma-70 factor (sigma-B/F/G subfamily)